MGRGRKPLLVELKEGDRATLEGWARRLKTAQALATRARIVLRAATGLNSTAISQELHLHLNTTLKWRRRFVEQGVDGLLDEPRPGQPRKISDADVEAVIARTLETKPADATHWSSRSMAKASGLNQTAVSRMWRAFALQPHRSESFKLSRDPLLIALARGTSGTARSRLQAARHRVSVRGARYENRRRAWQNVSPPPVARVPPVPRYDGAQRARRTGRALDSGQHATHKTPAIQRWLLKRPRFHVHFTPTSASWLNLVERWFAALTEKQIRRASFRSTRELEQAIHTFLDLHNAQPKPFAWTKSADDILHSIARFCTRINDSGH